MSRTAPSGNADSWVDVRCASPTCDRAAKGGRLLFRRRGDLAVKADSHSSLIARQPLGAICGCGAAWRNPDLDDAIPVPDQKARAG